jgi:hypothetical protein
VWAGAVTRATDELEIAWTLSGNDINGAATLFRDGSVYVGEVTGTVNGNSFDVHIAYMDLSGDFRYVGNFTDSQLTATITRNGNADGTMLLQRIGNNSLVTLAGNYLGTWTNSTTEQQGVLTVELSQEGNLAVGTYDDGQSRGSFTAAIIGNRFTAGLAQTGSGPRITWTSTITGTTIAGPYSYVRDGITNHGVFSVTRQ